MPSRTPQWSSHSSIATANPSVPMVDAFLEDSWRQFPRHPRTQATNAERIRSYILPFLPRGGETRLDELRRAELKLVQDALLRQRLSKTTIDGAFSALSALLQDAMDIELVDANVTARMRIRPADPRLDPARGPVERRSIPRLRSTRSWPASGQTAVRVSCSRWTTTTSIARAR
jgi:hypothetical protein